MLGSVHSSYIAAAKTLIGALLLTIADHPERVAAWLGETFSGTSKPCGCPAPTRTPASPTTSNRCSETKDRQAMRFAFDLWDYEDVKRHADAILDRLKAGTIPCDGPWKPEQIDAFERWVHAGVTP